MKRVLAAALAIVLFGALHSCERTSGVTLEFWTLSLRPPFTSYIEGRIDRFEQDNPGVTIRWVDVPFHAVERKLIAAAAAGRAPDVVNLSDMMFARFASRGAFIDLSEHLPDDASGRYHEGALRIGRLGDELEALPWYLTTQALIANEDVLARGGLSPDTLARTWDDLIDQARPFREQSGRFLFTQPLGEDSQIPVMLLAEGIAPFREDADGLLRADLTRPDVVAFVERWVDLYRSGAMPRQAATQGFEHLIDVYQNEQVACLNTGVNFLRRVRDTSEPVYDSSVVLPPLTGSLGRAHVAVMPVSVSAQSAHPDVAARFAWFITSPESQLEFCRLATILPSTPGSLEDPLFAGPTDSEREDGLDKVGYARAQSVRVLADAVAFTPAIEAWPEMRRAFNASIKSALLDGADVGEVLADIERRWNASIDEMNARRAASGGVPATLDAIPMPAPHAGGRLEP